MSKFPRSVNDRTTASVHDSRVHTSKPARRADLQFSTLSTRKEKRGRGNKQFCGGDCMSVTSMVGMVPRDVRSSTLPKMYTLNVCNVCMQNTRPRGNEKLYMLMFSGLILITTDTN